MNLWDLEMVVADEACRHAEAVAAINPYSEAEWISIGNTKCVYAGASSSIFGVYAFQESDWEEREWQDLERFFQRKERTPNFWVTNNTPAYLLDRISNSHRCSRVEQIFVRTCYQEKATTNTIANTSNPISNAVSHEKEALAGYSNSFPLADLDRWALLFSQKDTPSAKEPSYLASVKLHQKEIRFYENSKEASYTFFSSGYAYVPFVSESLREEQFRQAQSFRARFYLERSSQEKNPNPLGKNDFEFVFERKLYEPI